MRMMLTFKSTSTVIVGDTVKVNGMMWKVVAFSNGSAVAVPA